LFIQLLIVATPGAMALTQEQFRGAQRFHGDTRRLSRDRNNLKRIDMLGWALTFLIIAIIAAVFGFGGIAGVAVEAAKIIFFVAIVLFAISAVVGLMRGRSPTVP
jgi:uncharacterized membrane protein YtjA (UPF0391 family)